MKTFYSKDYNITKNKDITKELINILEEIKNTSGEKELIFESGNYKIDADLCTKKMLYITNTVGDNEFSADETPHANTIAIYLEEIQDLTIKGNGAIFFIDGKISNMAIINCKNITIDGIEFRHIHPDMHELKVINKSLFYVDFEIDEDTNYKTEDGKIFFYGKGYKSAINQDAVTSWWNGLIKEETPNKIKRGRHPLASAIKYKEISNRVVRVYYPCTSRFDLNDRFYVYDVRRQFVGIFADSSENIILNNVNQRFNYALAFVAQNCENITVDHCEFAPEKGSVRKVASVADFLHMCMCRGNINITNSYFDGAGDDCLNVHGIHFKIKDITNDTITVRFMHKQAHGFCPIRVGDTIAFIDPQTLLEGGTATVKKATLKNEYEIELQLDSTEEAIKGNVIEDTSACANVLFENNTLTRIITRGILLTTRGKVVVRNNHFMSNTMSGVLLSDDAKSWFESGMCKDVTIENNTFDYCGGTPILIKPENSKHEGTIHKNIVIKNNTFKKYDGCCIYAKSSENIKIIGNKFSSNNHLKTKNCVNVTID